jgi:hypothetical protein
MIQVPWESSSSSQKWHHNKIAAPTIAANRPPAACTSLPAAAFLEVVVVGELEGAEDVEPGVLVIPEFDGILVGVYWTARKFVKLVSLAVALPVISPAVRALVEVK